MSEWRDHFSLLGERSEIAYLDNAATTQKPDCVLDAMQAYYATTNANVHRAAHKLSTEATEAFENARIQVARHIHAERPEEIVWTKGTTEAINLVANCLENQVDSSGEIVVTEMEHHSNLVPWQMLAQRTGMRIRAVHVTPRGEIDLGHYEEILNERTALVAFTYVSNVLGTVNPVKDMAGLAHEHNALVLIDGAQAVAHLDVDVQELGGDFLAFSAHKVFGPTGMGVLWGRKSLLEDMPPWQGGGEMIETVAIDHFAPQGIPYRFEAGTPNIAGAIGMAEALDFLGNLDRERVQVHEDRLVALAVAGLKQIAGVRLVGEARRKTSVLSFLVEGAHPGDVGVLLDQQGVAVRTGHHCAMPLMAALDIPGTVRASFSLYNLESEVEQLVDGVEKARSLLLR